MIQTWLTSAVILADTAVSTEYAEDGTPLGSPGFFGFVITFILAVFIIFLMLDMSRRTRRMRYRNEYALAREAEANGLASQESPTGDGVPAPERAEEGLAEHIRRAH